MSHITNCTYQPSKLKLTTSIENWLVLRGSGEHHIPMASLVSEGPSMAQSG